MPETACPVCGSTDHPTFDIPALRRRREEADADLAATDTQLGAAVRTRTAAEVQIAEANRSLWLATIATAEGAYRQKAPVFNP